MAGTVLGTPRYMSPEQSLGAPIDQRSDVYSLGIVLFEMLTGVSPFERPTVTETLMAQVTQLPPSLRTVDPAISVELDKIVHRALAKIPSSRGSTTCASCVRRCSRSSFASETARPAPVPALKPVPAGARDRCVARGQHRRLGRARGTGSRVNAPRRRRRKKPATPAATGAPEPG